MADAPAGVRSPRRQEPPDRRRRPSLLDPPGAGHGGARLRGPRRRERAEGLAAIESDAPAFAVIDMRLGDGNGLDVIERLKERRPMPAA